MTVKDRLGLPDMRRRGRLVTSAAVDGLGSGLFVPFTVPFFVVVAHIDLVSVGAALSVAALIAVFGGPAAGPLIDRFGPTPVFVVSNVLRCAGFVGYLWVDTAWQVAVVATVISWAESTSWPANNALVVQVVGVDQSPRWYAFARSARNAGFGIGGLLAVPLITVGTGGYQFLVLVNAASFLIVAVSIATWRPARGRPASTPERQAAPKASYRQVFRDRSFALLLVANLAFSLVHLSLTFLLPVYMSIGLHGPAWLPSVMYSLNTVLLVLGQPIAVRRIERQDHTRVLRSAALLWAACFLILAALPAFAAPLAFTLLVLAVIIFTIAEILQGPITVVLVTKLAPPELRGRYLGLNQMSWNVAKVVAPIFYTSLLAIGPGWPCLALIAVCGTAYALLTVIGSAPSRLTPVGARERSGDQG